MVVLHVCAISPKALRPASLGQALESDLLLLNEWRNSMISGRRLRAHHCVSNRRWHFQFHWRRKQQRNQATRHRVIPNHFASSAAMLFACANVDRCSNPRHETAFCGSIEQMRPINHGAFSTIINDKRPMIRPTAR